MSARLIALVAVLLVIAGSALALVRFAEQPLVEPDVAEMNDLRERTEAHWGELNDAAYPDDAPAFTVTDLEGAILYSRGEPIADELAAIRVRAPHLTVEVAGAQVGRLFVASNDAAVLEARAAMLATSFAVVLGMVALAVTAYLAWVEWRILRPFRTLRGFAARVARGNLDLPLAMDRGNHFGAFTEAFDVMRTELAVARKAEREAKAGKQEFIAQLSHDIRTPVATIGAAAELLELHEADADRAQRLRLIVAKTQQIDELMAALVLANAGEIERLTIAPQPCSHEELAALIRAADVHGLLHEFALPAALLEIDPRRMAQVLDNVFANTSKYAGTRMRLTSALDEHSLEVRLRDFGPGVPEHEHPTLLGKGMRGSNATDTPGLGLGLYTAARLMERMGGALATRNAPSGGFEVVLTVPLSE